MKVDERAGSSYLVPLIFPTAPTVHRPTLRAQEVKHRCFYTQSSRRAEATSVLFMFDISNSKLVAVPRTLEQKVRVGDSRDELPSIPAQEHSGSVGVMVVGFLFFPLKPRAKDCQAEQQHRRPKGSLKYI